MDRNEQTRYVTVDGASIHSYKDFIDIIQEELDFPRDCEGMVDRYLDWMQDLQFSSWNRFVITIRNSDCLVNSDSRDLKDIISHFREIILPFWKDEYRRCIVDPDPKEIILKLE